MEGEIGGLASPSTTRQGVRTTAKGYRRGVIHDESREAGLKLLRRPLLTRNCLAPRRGHLFDERNEL